ncbi:MAG: alginate export family protein, partial [Verrucomicrobiota bacterium]
PRQDWLDIYRAELKIAISDDTSVTLGRQEISYGSRLVVGTPNYRNGRSFDAVQFRMDKESYKLSAAVGRQVERDRSQLNSSVDQPWIATLFLDSPASGRDGLSWDSILAFKHRDADAGMPIDVGTWGVRIKSPKSHRPWFWSAEAAYQFGSVSRGVERLDHTAWAFNGRIGRRFNNLEWKPNFSVEYFHSPGDGNPNDGKNETWDLMFFGGGHPRAGRMDLTGWRNIQYLSFTAKAKPHKTLTLGASQTGFWLESDQDGFYGQAGGAPRNGNGYGIRPGAPSDLGWETMIWANWKHASGFSLLIEAGNFSVGDYIEDSLSDSGGARNAQLVSITGTFRF